jgi:hypothetical protein
MIKLKDILQEIGDASAKAFPWKYDNTDNEDFRYKFQTDDGTYTALFTLSGSNEWDLSFGKGGGWTNIDTTTVTGVGPFRVMATLVEIVKDFLDNTFEKHIDDKDLYASVGPIYASGGTEELVPKMISFNTSKEGGRSEEEDSRRSNLYKAYIQKHVPGAKVEKHFSDSRSDFYTITLP